MDNDTIKELEQIKELFDLEILTEDEYENKRKNLLKNLNNDLRETNTIKSTKSHSNTENSTSATHNDSSESVKIGAKATRILSYLGIFWLLAYFAGDRREKFHLNQGLALHLVSIGLDIALRILTYFIYNYVFQLLASGSVLIFIIVMWVKGLIYAARGENTELPLIGQIKLFK